MAVVGIAVAAIPEGLPAAVTITLGFGLFALFKSRTPFSPDQIVSTIYARVLDLGAAGLDNLFGRGRIRVGSE